MKGSKSNEAMLANFPNPNQYVNWVEAGSAQNSPCGWGRIQYTISVVIFFIALLIGGILMFVITPEYDKWQKTSCGILDIHTYVN